MTQVDAVPGDCAGPGVPADVRAWMVRDAAAPPRVVLTGEERARIRTKVTVAMASSPTSVLIANAVVLSAVAPTDVVADALHVELVSRGTRLVQQFGQALARLDRGR